MAFHFDMLYIKENTILCVDALSKLKFGNENPENIEGRILPWVKMDILPQNWHGIETRQNTKKN